MRAAFSQEIRGAPIGPARTGSKRSTAGRVKCVLNHVSNRLPRQARTVYSLRAARGKRAVQSMRGMRGARCKQLVRLDALGPCVHVLNADQARHLPGAALLRKLGTGRGDVMLLGAVREEHHAALPVVSAAHIADAR